MVTGSGALRARVSYSSMRRLWSATRTAGEQARLYYQVFDVLRVTEKDLTTTPLIDRKDRLVELLRDGLGEPRPRCSRC